MLDMIFKNVRQNEITQGEGTERETKRAEPSEQRSTS